MVQQLSHVTCLYNFIISLKVMAYFTDTIAYVEYIIIMCYTHKLRRFLAFVFSSYFQAYASSNRLGLEVNIDYIVPVYKLLLTRGLDQYKAT